MLLEIFPTPPFEPTMENLPLKLMEEDLQIQAY